MVFKILMRYILGYVNISFEGYYIERFINVCISQGIFLWNVKIPRSTYAYANCGIKDFKRLKEIAKKTKCRLTINAKKGMPFLLNRYRKRKVFFGLIVLIICLLFIESRFVWNIQIEGTDRIPKEEILSDLSNHGLNVRSLKVQSEF